MSFAPREYQTKQIKDVMEALSVKQKILLQLPTGGGKTVMFSLIANEYITKHKKAVIILVHRKELLKQAANTIKENTSHIPVLIDQDAKKFIYSKIYIAMVESLKSRMGLIHNIGLVIIDECHIANFNKIHNVFKNHFFIGVSATPIGSSTKDPLKNYYNEIIPGVQIPVLIKTNYLSQNITRVPKSFIDITKFKINPLTGDYDEKDLSQEYLKIKNIKNTVEAYRRYHLGKKTIVFNVNIQHSKSVNEEFIFQGFNSKHLDSNAKDRDEILKWFKDTPDAILNNVMIATVGYDEPTIRVVMLNFDTLSLPKFLQTCGRGGRIINPELAQKFDCEPKFKFEITDMGSNAIRFGDWSDQRNWKDIFDNPDDPPIAGSPPKKVCPRCYKLVYAAIRICDCGYLFPLKSIGEDDELGEFVMVTQNIDYDKLNKKEITMEERYQELNQEEINYQERFKDLKTRIVDSTENEKALLDKEFDELIESRLLYFQEWKDLRQKLLPKRFEELLNLILEKCNDLIENNNIIQGKEKETFLEQFIKPSLKVLNPPDIQISTTPKKIVSTEIIKLTDQPSSGLIEVFHYFKRINKTVKANFDISTKKINYNQEKNLSPSKAAMNSITDMTGKTTSQNGWTFWNYIDESGKEKTIENFK